MSQYWFWYKFWRTWMWLFFIALSVFLLLGLIMGAYLFLMQRNHWQPCDNALKIPQDFRNQLDHFAESQGGQFVGCEVYWVENEPERKRQRRRGNYRFGIRVNNRTMWSYWSLLPSGSFRPESPKAYAIWRYSRP